MCRDASLVYRDASLVVKEKMNTSPTGAYARPVYCIHVGMQVLCSGLLLLCSGLLLLCSGLLLLCLGLLLLSLYVTMGQYIVPGSWNIGVGHKRETHFQMFA